MCKTKEENLKIGSGLEFSVFKRILPEFNETIIFIHGFGCEKENFLSAFASNSLNHYNLCTFDLLGHGNSSKPTNFDYSIKNLAKIIRLVLDMLKIQKFHVCAHSMGGLIGIELVSQIPTRVKSLINLEGNLTLEDCFGTGRVIEFSYEDFLAKGRKEIEKNLDDAQKKGKIPSSYLGSYKKVTSEALYKYAADTVTISSDPELIFRFIKMKNRCYIYGEKNRNLFPAEQKLKEASVPLFYISNAGHALYEDNPLDLFYIIQTWIEKIRE